MSGMSSLGVGSGLDLNSLVNSLVQAERAPKLNRLNRQQATAETQLSALGRLRSAVSGLNDAVKALDGFEVKRSATSTDSATVGAKADAGVETGSYRVQVHHLATAQSLATAAFDDAEAPLGIGTVTVGQGEEQLVIELGDEVSSLYDVRDAINRSELDIQAVVVRDGGGSRLLLTAGQTGVEGQMSLTVDGGADPRLASANMTETAAAADASFSVNGLQLTSSSNTVDDVIPGLELTLKKTTEGSDSVTVGVAQDRAGARSRMDAVVKAYNTLADTIRQLGRANPEGESGPLVGDTTLRSLQMHLGRAFTTAHGTDLEDNPFGMMLDLGLSVDVEGRASLDADRLNAALGEDEAGVEALMSAFGKAFGGTLNAFSGSDGSIGARTEGLNAQLKRVGDQRNQLDRRMAQLEQRLRTQYSALDSALAQMQSTSAYLEQQLSGLANLRR